MNQTRRIGEQRADDVLGFAASSILFSMMTLTFVDVVLRYVFNRPVRGGFELTELMLLVLIFAGLPLVTHAGEHVTMDLIDRFLGPRLRALQLRLTELASAGLMFGLTWLMWVKAGKIAAYGDTTDILRIPVGPFVYFMTAMILVSGLVHLFRAVFPPERA
ncbi:MAG: TRAP transporter small permease [Betaproteobacteria bacterium]|nr:TRAP transporter small permease [Betaproteobacteria bacterium]